MAVIGGKIKIQNDIVDFNRAGFCWNFQGKVHIALLLGLTTLTLPLS
jgi:hypothetical protein